MRVLVACEFSGIVREAFIAKGHDAISCDFLSSEIPGPHIQGDVREILNDEWDMMIAFPPCTHLSRAGCRWWRQKKADGRVQQSVDFVKILRNAPIRRIAIENPVGLLWKYLRPPTQCIQPYQFGDAFYKKTCLWLYNLPRLTPTKIVPPEGHWVDSGTTRGKNRNSKKRAITFPGIAQAMADQWGHIDPSEAV